MKAHKPAFKFDNAALFKFYLKKNIAQTLRSKQKSPPRRAPCNPEIHSLKPHAICVVAPDLQYSRPMLSAWCPVIQKRFLFNPDRQKPRQHSMIL
jgi:hypothetical protein